MHRCLRDIRLHIHDFNHSNPQMNTCSTIHCREALALGTNRLRKLSRAFMELCDLNKYVFFLKLSESKFCYDTAASPKSIMTFNGLTKLTPGQTHALAREVKNNRS